MCMTCYKENCWENNTLECPQIKYWRYIIISPLIHPASQLCSYPSIQTLMLHITQIFRMFHLLIFSYFLRKKNYIKNSFVDRTSETCQHSHLNRVEVSTKQYNWLWQGWFVNSTRIAKDIFNPTACSYCLGFDMKNYSVWIQVEFLHIHSLV